MRAARLVTTGLEVVEVAASAEPPAQSAPIYFGIDWAPGVEATGNRRARRARERERRRAARREALSVRAKGADHGEG